MAASAALLLSAPRAADELSQQSDEAVIRFPDDHYFDPRTWGLTRQATRPVYLSNRDASLVAMIDEIDYQWARQWQWSFVHSRIRVTEKLYARRVATNRWGARVTVYLHKEILRRAAGPPPSVYHCIGDHRNGDSLDCRRANLRWATPTMNAMNVFGRYPNDLIEG